MSMDIILFWFLDGWTLICLFNNYYLYWAFWFKLFVWLWQHRPIGTKLIATAATTACISPPSTPRRRTNCCRRRLPTKVCPPKTQPPQKQQQPFLVHLSCLFLSALHPLFEQTVFGGQNAHAHFFVQTIYIILLRAFSSAHALTEGFGFCLWESIGQLVQIGPVLQVPRYAFGFHFQPAGEWPAGKTHQRLRYTLIPRTHKTNVKFKLHTQRMNRKYLTQLYHYYKKS